MNKQLKIINKWLISNNSALNLSKTVYLTFGSYKSSVPKILDIKIKDTQITRVEITNFLGITIDYHLKWQYSQQ